MCGYKRPNSWKTLGHADAWIQNKKLMNNFGSCRSMDKEGQTHEKLWVMWSADGWKIKPISKIFILADGGYRKPNSWKNLGHADWWIESAELVKIVQGNQMIFFAMYCALRGWVRIFKISVTLLLLSHRQSLLADW